MSDKNSQIMSSSDFNMEKLTTRELEKHLAATIQIVESIAIFGRRGTGKSVIAKQAIKNADMHEAYINMSVIERTDLSGFPKILSSDPNRKFVDFLLPQFLQPMVEGKKKVVALLDEVDKADPSLWAPLLEFVQFHSINGVKLPNLQASIMTGNLISEGGARPSLPLLDRAEKYLVEADAASWITWAGAEGHIHPAITAYINDHPKDLFGAVDPEDRYSDPSPRGWHRASEILHKGEERGWSSALLNKKVCGCIGKDAGIRYSNYYEHYQELLPMVEDIYRGKNVSDRYQALEPTKQLVACMIACARLATQLDQAKETKSAAPSSLVNVGKFLQGVSYENILVAVRSQIQIGRIIEWSLDDQPEWREKLEMINKNIA